jgi:endonuclease G
MKPILLFFILSTVAFAQPNPNTVLGYPDSAGFIIDRSQYVISYCGDLNSARWASWSVDKNCYGKAKRFRGNFITDTTLPENYTIIKHSDYTNTGFDRGHLVKSEDRTQTPEDNKTTFFLTNAIPKTPALNRGVWAKLENYCKNLCKKNNKTIFVIAGGLYSENSQKLNEKIAIPDSCWKVILILDSGQTVADIDTNTQTIAVMMPNNFTIDKTKKWYDFLTTVRAIEQSTGFNFYRYVEEEIQAIIENRIYK